MFFAGNRSLHLAHRSPPVRRTFFDVAATKGNRSLGLVSMQERVYAVHRSLHVESEPGKGTKILAVVPLVGERQGSPENHGVEESEGVVGQH
jgi:hypothetical protein